MFTPPRRKWFLDEPPPCRAADPAVPARTECLTATVTKLCLDANRWNIAFPAGVPQRSPMTTSCWPPAWW